MNPATLEAIRAAVASFLNDKQLASHDALANAGGLIRVCSYVRARLQDVNLGDNGGQRPRVLDDNMALYNAVKECVRDLLPE